MISFQQAVFPFLLLSFIIVAGYYYLPQPPPIPKHRISPISTPRNPTSSHPPLLTARNTGFPLLLRLTIYILFKLSPAQSIRKKTYAFLLDHPRRCFTLLFPRDATWWLFAVLLVLNLADLVFFLVLDLGDDYVLSIPVGYRILDGLFQVGNRGPLITCSPDFLSGS